MRRFTTLLIGLLFTLPAYAFHEQVLWERAGGGPHSGLGCIILPLGDQNHDGYADWAVHSCGEHDTSDSPGMTEFFHGGNPPSTTPYMVLRRSEGTRLLMVSYNAGDVNGDGYEDWLTYDNFVAGCSLVRLHYGGPDTRVDSNVVFRIAFDNLSWERVTPIGDFNGDGFDDLCWWHLAGWSRIYYGGTAPDSVPDWTMTDPPGQPYLSWPATQESYGDITGDGAADLVTQPNETNEDLAIFRGGAAPDTLVDLLCPSVGFVLPAIVQDVNGDGISDLAYKDNGHLELHWGGPGLSCTPQAVLNLSSGYLLDEISSVGDINGDGYGDFAVIEGTPGGDQLVSLYLGSPWPNPNPVWVQYGWSGYGLLGLSEVEGLGDINGDGINDFALGAADDDNPRGKMVIFSGDTTMRLAAEEPRGVAVDFALAAYPNPFNSTTEIRYTVPRASHVSLKVFDVMGQEVDVLVNGVVNAGEGRVAWQAEGVASGVYFVRLEAGDVGVTRKVMLVR